MANVNSTEIWKRVPPGILHLLDYGEEPRALRAIESDAFGRNSQTVREILRGTRTPPCSIGAACAAGRPNAALHYGGHGAIQTAVFGFGGTSLPSGVQRAEVSSRGRKRQRP